MKKILLFILAIAGMCGMAAAQKAFNLSQDVFGLRAFIENNGQFDHVPGISGKINFVYDGGDEIIYFTDHGLVYQMRKSRKIDHEQWEKIEHGELDKLKNSKVSMVQMNWVDCGKNISIEKSEKTGHYFTYGDAKFNSFGYRRIVYKEVYPGIDIEYVIPADRSFGIKYNVIIHPKADPSQVKIAYTGDVNSIRIKDNEAVIKTSIGKIIEHAPVSFTTNKMEVQSEFKLENNVIGFAFPASYDNTKELVIDPWVTTTTTLTTSGSGYDVDYDFSGNLYVYGGTNPFKVAKYGPFGNLIWTFSGVVPSITWSSGFIFLNMPLAGNFVVDKASSKVFVGSPYEQTGPRVIRLDVMGNYDNFVSTPNTSFVEIWEMAYDCAANRVVALGGYQPYNLASFVPGSASTATLTLSTVTVSATNTDFQCGIFDSNGDFYTHHTPNMMRRYNNTLTSAAWLVSSTFSNLTYLTAKSSYQATAVSGQGFNCLAVNSNYLYFYDGYNLAAYNKATGSIIGSITLGSHVPKVQGGIDCDDCNNIYVGGNNGAILHYFFNGSSFSFVASINTGATTTNKAVYDLKLNRASNLIYYSGSGFAGVVSANSASCASSANNCVATIPPTFTTICNGSSANINILNVNNLTNPTYSVQPGNLSSSSSNFNVSPTVTTVYTVYVTGTNAFNATETNTSTATVSVVPTPSANPSLFNGTCTNPTTSSVNLNISFTPSATVNYTLLWNPMPSNVITVNSYTASGLVPGINNVTVVTSNGCSTTVTFSVPPVPQPASFVVVNPANDYTLTCLNTNVLLTASVTNGVPLSFTWTPNCTNTLVSANMNFNQPCAGQVVGTSSTGCQMIQTFTIYSDYSAPTVAITPSVQNLTCSGGSGCFTLTSNLAPNVTTNWFQVQGTNTLYVGTAQGTINIFCASAPGIYWGESVYNLTGCKTTGSVQVSASVGVPVFTLTSPSNFTLGCSSKSITSMQVTTVITSPVPNVPVNYAFVAPPGTATPVYNVNPNQNGIFTPGTWVVYIKDLTNNCVSSQSVNIIQNILPPHVDLIQPLSILSCKDPSMVLNGISTNTNTNITWTVPAFPGSSVNPTPNATVNILPSIAGATNNVIAIGVWTVGAVDNNNFCTSIKTVQVNEDVRVPRFTISALSNSVINCINPDVVIIPIVTPSLAGALVPTYMWFPPVGQGVPGSQFNSSSAGTHTAISTSAVNGCTALATYNVASDLTPPAIQSELQPFILDCNENPTVVITPSIAGSTSGLVYSWTVPAGAITSNLSALNITSNKIGSYMITVTNTLNGCVAQNVYNVVEGGIMADFIAEPTSGIAPLLVTFTNTSSTSTGASSIVSTWGYGNGAVTPTVYNTSPVSTTYTSAGTYTVYLKVRKGNCIAETKGIITVEMPSKIVVPNVFTPNGDKVNDLFKLQATNLKKIYVIIFDRWGNKVYEVTSETGNFAWDGNSQTGKECAAGTYFYIIKADGYDGKEFEEKGNVSLFR